MSVCNGRRGVGAVISGHDTDGVVASRVFVCVIFVAAGDADKFQGAASVILAGVATGGASLRVVGAVYAMDGGAYLLCLPIEGGLNSRRRPITGQEGVVEFILGIEGFDLPASCAGAYSVVCDDGSDTLGGGFDDVPFL